MTDRARMYGLTVVLILGTAIVACVWSLMAKDAKATSDARMVCIQTFGTWTGDACVPTQSLGNEGRQTAVLP